MDDNGNMDAYSKAVARQ